MVSRVKYGTIWIQNLLSQPFSILLSNTTLVGSGKRRGMDILGEKARKMKIVKNWVRENIYIYIFFTRDASYSFCCSGRGDNWDLAAGSPERSGRGSPHWPNLRIFLKVAQQCFDNWAGTKETGEKREQEMGRGKEAKERWLCIQKGNLDLKWILLLKPESLGKFAWAQVLAQLSGELASKFGKWSFCEAKVSAYESKSPFQCPEEFEDRVTH